MKNMDFKVLSFAIMAAVATYSLFSSKATNWQPKAYCNLNFQPENVLAVLIPIMSVPKNGRNYLAYQENLLHH